MNTVHASSPSETLRLLGEQIQRFEGARRGASARQVISSGHQELDRWLPDRGFCRGSLVEWLASGPGSGAVGLSLAAAHQACGADRALIVVDRTRGFYPPAAGLAVDWSRLILVRPENDEDEAWTIDQSLRCEGVGAVLCWPRKLDDHTFRRWQLAAEASGVLGLLIRSEHARREPTWAEVRLRVTPRPTVQAPRSARRVSLQILRCRGASTAQAIELQLDADPKRK